MVGQTHLAVGQDHQVVAIVLAVRGILGAGSQGGLPVRPADPHIPGDLGDSSTDPAFVKPGAIAWLKLTVTGTEKGPTDGDTLTKTTFIQRLNTFGGVAPPADCASPADVGKQAFVPYTADYFFYEKQ